MDRWWRRRRAPWAIMALALCAWLPLAFVWYAVRPQSRADCGGVGWDALSCGWDAGGMAHLFFGIPFAAGAVLSLALLELLGPRAQGARLTVSVLFLVAPWASSAYVVVAG